MRSLACLSFGLALCAACGEVKDNGMLADAPPATVDAPPEMPTTGVVHVTVLDSGGGGAGAVGAKVVFINPDGTVVKQVATDSAGKAEAEIMVGASVTAVQLVGINTQLQTVTGLKPNDDITIGVKNADSTTMGTMTVRLPTLSGANYYTVSSPCGGGFVSQPAGTLPATVDATLTYYAYCNTPAEIIVSANDPNGATLSSTKVANVAFSAGLIVVMPAYAGTRSFTASYTNVNPKVAFMTSNRYVPDLSGLATSASSAQPPTASTVLTYNGPLATTAMIETTASIEGNARQFLRQTLSGSAATYGLDVSATLLPWLATPTLDVATRKVTIGVDTTGTTTATPDLARLSFSFRRTDPQTQAVTTYSWVVWGGALGDVTLPPLPAELAVLPTSTDVLGVASVSGFEADTVAGYDAVRADVNAAFTKYTGARPPAALVRITQSPLIRRL
jgi:hypothetical protein